MTLEAADKSEKSV